jgi:hypothetical protein
MISGGPAAVLILDLTNVDKVASIKSYEVERVHDMKDVMIHCSICHFTKPDNERSV